MLGIEHVFQLTDLDSCSCFFLLLLKGSLQDLKSDYNGCEEIVLGKVKGLDFCCLTDIIGSEVMLVYLLIVNAFVI